MWKRLIDFELEIPASRVFLGADAQLLGTSLAGTKIPLSICLKNCYLNLNLGFASLSTLLVGFNIRSLALIDTKAKTD